MDDHDLIQKALKGEQEAYASLYRKYHPYLLNRFRNHGNDAEDIVQDAFLKAFSKLNYFKGGSQFYTWLYRIALNEMLMKRRKRSILLSPLSLDDIPHPSFRDARLELTGERMELLKLVAALPPSQRRIYLLHEFEGFQHNEISARVGCSIGTSKSQLSKAKARLRLELPPSPLSLHSPHPYA